MVEYTSLNINQANNKYRQIKQPVITNSNSKIKKVSNRHTKRQLTKRYTPLQFKILMEIFLEISKRYGDTLQLSQTSIAQRSGTTREYVNKSVALFIAREDLECYIKTGRSYTYSERLFYRVPLNSIYYKAYHETKASLTGMTAVSQQLFTHLMLYNLNYINNTKNTPREFPEGLVSYGRAPQIRHEVPHRPREFPQKGRKDSFLMLASLVGKTYQVNSDTVLEGYSGLSRHDKYLLKSDVVPEPAVPLKELTPEVSEIFDKAFPEVQNKVYTSPLKVSVQPVERVAKPNGLSRDEIQEFINRTRERYLSQTPVPPGKAQETH